MRREALIAQRKLGVSGEGHPAIWRPWETLVKEAEARMRVELNEALRQLESDTAKAGQIIDVAAALADQASKQLAQSAWHEWRRLMTLAGDAAEAVLEPARQAYDNETERAGREFDVAVTSAKRAYERAIRDADQAKTLAEQMKKAT